MKKNLFNLNSIKKTILSVTFSIALVINGFSQPTLQSSDLQTGLSLDVYSLGNVNTSNLSTSGANVTWNLGSAVTATLIATVDFMDMASTGYASQYPAANFAMKFTIGATTTYNFWNLTSSVWEEVAINVGSSGLQTFIDYRTDLIFPYTFNLTNTDTYQKNGQSATTVTHTYDSYGTVNTNTISITNLIRDIGTDNGTGTTQAIWWNTSPIYPVLQADNSGVTLYQLTSSTGVHQVKQELSFHVYPNPANNELHIINEKPMNKIEIYNVIGQLQLTTTQSLIDIANLPSGVYIIKAYIEDRIETTKIIKQ